MKRFALVGIAGLMLAAPGAEAQVTAGQCGCDPLVVMIDEGVRGDIICPGSQTRDALLRHWGASRPDGASILVIRKSSGKTAWAPEGSTPEGLAREAGVPARFTGSAADRAACFGTSPICPAPQRNALGKVQPKNGLWRSSIGEMTITGCPAQLASAVASAVPASLGEGEERRSFSDPFHPSSMLIGLEQGNQTWVDLPEGGWQTEFVPDVINAQQAAGASTSVTMTMQVACDTMVEGQSVIDIRLPEVARALIGVGPEGCRIERPYQLQWVGD